MHKILEDMKDCYGCTACKNICPTEAIEMKCNNEGFIEPVIDEKKCINCEACKRVCPSLHPQFDNSDIPEAIAFQADKETLMESSSGGAFRVLANNTILNGGVVFGAAFDDKWKVRHISVESKKNLNKLAFSKYLQSDTEDTFSEAKELLENGRKVLYVGCPCQIAGLKKYLGKNYDNLLSVDLLCHGVPSPGAFSSYLEENFNAEQIKKIDFRSGEKQLVLFNIENSDGTFEQYTVKSSTFVNSFLKDFNLRTTCYDCKFSKIPRQGDITIGDLWKASKIELDFPDKKTSIVLLNNHKGVTDFYKAVSFHQQLCHIKKIDLKNKFLNKNIFRSTVDIGKISYRDEFFQTYKDMGFNKAYDEVFKRMYHFDIGLVLYMSNNYGSCATNVALYKHLEKKGYSPIIMDTQVGLGALSREYSRKFLNLSSKIIESGDNKAANKLCDIFMVGSDQSANWDIVGVKKTVDMRLLGFADNDKLKIAYGISFGNNRPIKSDILKKLYIHLLNRFDNISVREDYAVDICKNNFGVEACHVADPIFLPEQKDWTEIANNSEKSISGDYILAYILVPTEDKKKLIEKASEKEGIKNVVILDAAQYEEKRQQMGMDSVIERPSFEEWVSYFYNAKYVITDSFHGTCLSLIFEKKVAVIKARSKNRFDSLAALLKMDGEKESIIYNNAEEALQSPELFKRIDYDFVNKIIGNFRKSSVDWLDKALKSKPKHSFDDTNDILTDYSDLYRKYLPLYESMDYYKYEESIKEKKIDLSSQAKDYLEVVLNLYNESHLFKRPDFVKISAAEKYFEQVLKHDERYMTVISCNDECSKHFQTFVEKTSLQLQLTQMPYRSSFIVILKGSELLFEKASDDMLYKKYHFSDDNNNSVYVSIVSSGNKHGIKKSSIIVNNIDYSLNKRGLNFVIIDSRLGNVVDTFNIDTHADGKLSIDRSL